MNQDKLNIVKNISEYIQFLKRYNLFPLHNDGLMLTEALKSLENFELNEAEAVSYTHLTLPTILRV